MKNMDPEKHGSWKTWNIYGMSDFRELCFNKIYISTHKIDRANNIDRVNKFI